MGVWCRHCFSGPGVFWRQCRAGAISSAARRYPTRYDPRAVRATTAQSEPQSSAEQFLNPATDRQQQSAEPDTADQPQQHPDKYTLVLSWRKFGLSELGFRPEHLGMCPALPQNLYPEFPRPHFCLTSAPAGNSGRLLKLRLSPPPAQKGCLG